jgi:tRNA pseudouridine13 synthase
MNTHQSILPDWPHSQGEPLVSGKIRVQLEDFRVQEIPLITPSGEGNHLWLEVEKRGANTHWVAEQLAAAAGIPARDVGFAGLKDRHGITAQWFSVALQEAGNPEWETWQIQDVKFLNVQKHNRKLKRGALKGNRFHLLVRDLEGDTPTLAERIQQAAVSGVPNYFGPQRFGFNGSNITRGMHWLQRGGRMTRNKRGIYISSVRSFLFNQVLAHRVNLGNWAEIVDGEVAMLNGSHSVFPCTMPDAELSRRCETFDIHPTGPLCGDEGMQPERAASTLENEALADHSDMIDALKKVSSRADRRSLRLLPENLLHQLEGDVLTLTFELPAGNYATSLLRELVTCTDDGHIPEP